jgi:tRNA(Ile2) C34 agmatinyltransferase TiaS
MTMAKTKVIEPKIVEKPVVNPVISTPLIPAVNVMTTSASVVQANIQTIGVVAPFTIIQVKFCPDCKGMLTHVKGSDYKCEHCGHGFSGLPASDGRVK